MNAKPKLILLIEDEPHIALGLSDALAFEGFQPIVAGTGEEGIRVARERRPDAILLDLMLPGINGYDVCQAIRSHDSRVPILMLTARSQEVDKIRGLDAGADDYVTKPFSVGELVARIRAMFRRVQRSASGPELFSVGELSVNLQAHTIERGGVTEHQLSFYEVELLRLLMEKAGQPVARDEILTKIWGLEANPSNRTIDNFVVKLRKKLEKHPDRPQHILTVYGYGYKLVP
ncbi:MAG TPA: response regulator transcription factor [Polyangiaceae bacterium]|nr:response regulator transcription factor [Polyangiaceae bacterium]